MQEGYNRTLLCLQRALKRHGPEGEPWSTIEGQIDSLFSVKLVSRKEHRIKTRRDLMEFWEDYCIWRHGSGEGRDDVMYLLSEPLKELDSQVSYLQFKFTMVLSHARSPKVVYQESFKGILDFKVKLQNAREMGEASIDFVNRSRGEFYIKRRSEQLCHPDHPLYDHAPWIPAQ